jgi:hypothetical protein
MKILLAAVFVLSSLGSCASPEFVENKPRKVPTEKDCAARGEFLDRGGMFASATCVRRFADAGKVCRSKSDCLGSCIIELGTAENREREYQVGQMAEGRCARQSALAGCLATVDGGKVTQAECVD